MNFNVKMIENVIENENLFDLIKSEVIWADSITHKGGKLPCNIVLQADIINNNIPLYRHPLDNIPDTYKFTPTISKIKNILENKLNTKFNHAIIQMYKDCNDHISEHSDKTLDIVKDSLIVNFSIGESRVIRFRSKDKYSDGKYNSIEKYDIFDIELSNNSALVLDLNTNRHYRHLIRKNNNIKNPRISITFRNIGTFINDDIIFGQGINNDFTLTKDELLLAWHTENNSSKYDWDQLYSKGYNKSFINL